MTARLANGGHAVIPRLTRDQINERTVTERPQKVAWPSCGVSPQHLSLVHRGMRGVVNDPRGTAFKARITNAAWAMAGKTGTAQVRRITEEERRNGLRKPDQVPWRERDHALFVAYAPVEEPRYAIAVVVEHGGGGSTVAAPIARDIMTEIQKRDQERGVGGTKIAERPGERPL
jgi:penicillin-binding protein 2